MINLKDKFLQISKPIKFTFIAIAAIWFVCFPLLDLILWIESGFVVNTPAIDSCLDRGGAWNYEGQNCEFE